ARTTLPSSRALATDLRVSRSTVVLAYDQLRAEGYLVSRPGGGTRVANSIVEVTITPKRVPVTRQQVRPIAVPPRFTAALRHVLIGEPRAPRAFRSGVPALDAFP